MPPLCDILTNPYRYLPHPLVISCQPTQVRPPIPPIILRPPLPPATFSSIQPSLPAVFTPCPTRPSPAWALPYYLPIPKATDYTLDSMGDGEIE
jgi:hypothetical protein